MKIAVTFSCTKTQEHKLAEACKKYGAELFFLTHFGSETEKRKLLISADIILGEPDMDVIYENPNLKWIQMTWAGTDKYTMKQERPFPEHIELTNMSGAFGMIMSEYAIGAILQVYRHFDTYREQQKQGLWQDAGAEECLYGKRVLLLGTGDIGSSLALKCKAFGMETVGLRRKATIKPQGFDEVYTLEEIDKELPKADIVAASLPNKPNTRHLLTKERLCSMKPEAVLLNMGRGTLLEVDELAEVLQKGHLRAAILDVTNPEPLPKEHPLWQCERAYITPHIAGPSFGHCPVTQEFIIDSCIKNMERYFTGKPLLHKIERADFE